MCTDTCSELGKIINYYTVDAHARGEQVPQVTPEEIFFVSSTLQAYRHHENKRPNFLVFGCGFDSPMWVRLNCGGRTAFIENSAEWVEIVVSKNPELETHVVTYTTKLSERAQYFANPVPMDMPAAVADECWDIALVDAPAGYDGSTPGRMQPVHFAISNIKRCFEQRPEMKHAFVYMHDAQRRGEEDIENHMLFPNAQHLGLVNNMIGFRFTRETLKME